MMHLILGEAKPGYERALRETSSWSSCSSCGSACGESDSPGEKKSTNSSIHTGRRLKSIETMMAELENMQKSDLQFIGASYAVRAIDLDSIFGETFVAPLVSTGEAFLSLLKPFHHHELWLSFGNETEKRHLIIDMQRCGVTGKVVDADFLIDNPHWQLSNSFNAPIEPEWVLNFLSEFGGKQYSAVAWNCQHFTRSLAQHIEKACRTQGLLRCPFDDGVDFPSRFMDSWWNVVSVAALGVAVVVLVLILTLKICLTFPKAGKQVLPDVEGMMQVRLDKVNRQ